MQVLLYSDGKKQKKKKKSMNTLVSQVDIEEILSPPILINIGKAQ